MDLEVMKIDNLIFACGMAGLVLSLFLYVVFGQITVRKLRKNPKSKDQLGMEFVSGWDILNVAGALSLPRWINRKLRETPLSFMYADADLLDKHTNWFDRVLAIIFYGLFMLSSLSLIVLMLLINFDVFD